MTNPPHDSDPGERGDEHPPQHPEQPQGYPSPSGGQQAAYPPQSERPPYPPQSGGQPYDPASYGYPPAPSYSDYPPPPADQYQQGQYQQGQYQQPDYQQDPYQQQAPYQQPPSAQQDYQPGYQPQYQPGYPAPSSYGAPAAAPGAYDQPPYDPAAPQHPGYPQQPSYPQQQDYPQQPPSQQHPQQQDYPQQGYPPQPPPAPTAMLSVGDGSGRTFPLQQGSNVIGRGQNAAFRLPDTSVSRRHADLYFDGRTAVLHDLGSTNGTTVNGASVQTWQLADGDVIRLGQSTVIFSFR